MKDSARKNCLLMMEKEWLLPWLNMPADWWENDRYSAWFRNLGLFELDTGKVVIGSGKLLTLEARCLARIAAEEDPKLREVLDLCCSAVIVGLTIIVFTTSRKFLAIQLQTLTLDHSNNIRTADNRTDPGFSSSFVKENEIKKSCKSSKSFVNGC